MRQKTARKMGYSNVFKKEVSDALLREFNDAGAKVLHNCYFTWPNGDKSEADLVMVTQRGIYVVECKDYSGYVEGSDGGGEAYHPNTLTFTGGTITATGGDAAAGIGGGSEGGGGTVIIEGSKTLITATCGKGAEYGIGPGQHVEDGNLRLGSGVHMKISDNGKDWSDYTDKGKKYMKTVI